MKFQDTTALESEGYWFFPEQMETQQKTKTSLWGSPTDCAAPTSFAAASPSSLKAETLFLPLHLSSQNLTWPNLQSFQPFLEHPTHAGKHFAHGEEGDKEQRNKGQAIKVMQSLRQASKWSLIILFCDFCLPPQSLADTVPSKANSWREPAGLGVTQGKGSFFLNISCCIPAICSMSASQPSPIILVRMGEKGRNIPHHFSRLMAEHTFSFHHRQIQLQNGAVVSKFSVVTSEHRLKISCFYSKWRPSLRFFKTRCLIFLFFFSFLWDFANVEIFYVCQLPISVWKAQLPHLVMQLHRHSKLCTRLASSFEKEKKNMYSMPRNVNTCKNTVVYQKKTVSPPARLPRI